METLRKVGVVAGIGTVYPPNVGKRTELPFELQWPGVLLSVGTSPCYRNSKTRFLFGDKNLPDEDIFAFVSLFNFGVSISSNILPQALEILRNSSVRGARRRVSL